MRISSCDAERARDSAGDSGDAVGCLLRVRGIVPCYAEYGAFGGVCTAKESQKTITFLPMDLPSACVLNAVIIESPVNSNLLFTGIDSVFAAIIVASMS